MKKIATLTTLLLLACSSTRVQAAVMPEQIMASESVNVAITYKEEKIVGEDKVTLHYVVTKEGETVNSISWRFALGEDYLLSVNPEYQKEGTFAMYATVALPEVVYWPDVPEGVYYYIDSGDTLTEISECFNSTVEKIVELNPQIKNPDRIYAGEIIRVI